MRLPILIRLLSLLAGVGATTTTTARGETGKPERHESAHRTPFDPFNYDICSPPVHGARVAKDRQDSIGLNTNLKKNNPPPTMFCVGYCWSRSQWSHRMESDYFMDIWPRVGYAYDHFDKTNMRFRWSWSVWAEKVDAGKYASSTLAILLLDEREMDQQQPPLAGVIVTDPEGIINPALAPTTNFSVLLPGHYLWGEEVSEKTSVYLPSALFPEHWCRVWASGARLIVHQGRNYTLVDTLESVFPNDPYFPNDPVLHAALLKTTQRAGRILPKQTMCTSFGFPEGDTDLRRVDCKVVECVELESDPNPVSYGGGLYFCVEFEQGTRLDFQWGIMESVEWDVPQVRRWPIYCQNWTSSNSVDEWDGGDGTFLFAGFVRNLQIVEGRVIALSQYFYFQNN